MICGMTYYQICWYFLIYSFGGWALEVVYHAVACGKVHVVCFLTLRELHHLVQRFPSPIEYELHRNKCDLVRGNDLSLQCFDFLLFH